MKLPRELLTLDLRVLSLLAVALPTVILAVGWGQLLRPAWQIRQAAAARVEAEHRAIADLPASHQRATDLEREATRLEAALDAPDTAPARLPALLEQLAGGRQIELQPIFPGQPNEADGLQETRYEVNASGSYPQLVGWLAAIESRLPNAGLQEVRFARQTDGAPVTLHLRLSIYRRAAAAQP